MAIATINPATGETIKTFDALTDAQVDQKIQKATETFRTFRKLTFADRAKHDESRRGDSRAAKKTRSLI